MCKIISVAPRDYHIVLDFSYTQLDHLLMYLDSCKANPDLKDPKNKDWEAADQYVRKNLFPMLDKLCDEIKEQR